MKACKRAGRILAGVVSVMAAGVIVASLGWVPGSQEILANTLETQIGYERLVNTGHYLDERLVSERTAMQTKRRVADDVIAGRLTLLQAAAHFREADAGVHSYSLRARLNQLPGNSDAERECYKVINYVEIALDDEPSERDALVSRLTAQLRAELQRNDGSLTLPETQSRAI